MRQQGELLRQPIDHRLGCGPDNLRAIHGGHDVVEKDFQHIDFDVLKWKPVENLGVVLDTHTNRFGLNEMSHVVAQSEKEDGSLDVTPRKRDAIRRKLCFR